MTTKNNTIDCILSDYKAILGNDYKVYKNHVYRIYNFVILLDSNEKNYDKYAIAAAFHDIGIWTHSFDYLKPSIKLASAHLTDNNQENWIEEISLMINYHHKMSVYKLKHQQTVETFRKADWIDVTYGFKKHTISSSDFKAVQKEFPNKGFHLFLVKQSLKYFLKHPFNPLPMFKK